jgi:hypothetical protein
MAAPGRKRTDHAIQTKVRTGCPTAEIRPYDAALRSVLERKPITPATALNRAARSLSAALADMLILCTDAAIGLRAGK